MCNVLEPLVGHFGIRERQVFQLSQLLFHPLANCWQPISKSAHRLTISAGTEIHDYSASSNTNLRLPGDVRRAMSSTGPPGFRFVPGWSGND